MTTESQPSPLPAPPLASPVPTPTADPSPSGSPPQTAGAAVTTQVTGVLSSSIEGYGDIADLTQDEFNSTGVAKLMYQELRRLRAELRVKIPFEVQFFDERQKVAVLQQELAGEKQLNGARDVARNIADIIFGVFLFAAGVAGSDAYGSANEKASNTLYYIALGLVVLAMIAKLYAEDAFKKWSSSK